MGDLVNLRQERKRKQRDQKAKKADANRALHGRSREERRLTDAEHQKADKHLDGHRLMADASEPVSDAGAHADQINSGLNCGPVVSDGPETKDGDAAPVKDDQTNVISIFSPNIPDRQ